MTVFTDVLIPQTLPILVYDRTTAWESVHNWLNEKFKQKIPREQIWISREYAARLERLERDRIVRRMDLGPEQVPDESLIASSLASAERLQTTLRLNGQMCEVEHLPIRAPSRAKPEFLPLTHRQDEFYVPCPTELGPFSVTLSDGRTVLRNRLLTDEELHDVFRRGFEACPGITVHGYGCPPDALLPQERARFKDYLQETQWDNLAGARACMRWLAGKQRAGRLPSYPTSYTYKHTIQRIEDEAGRKTYASSGLVACMALGWGFRVRSSGQGSPNFLINVSKKDYPIIGVDSPPPKKRGRPRKPVDSEQSQD